MNEDEMGYNIAMTRGFATWIALVIVAVVAVAGVYAYSAHQTPGVQSNSSIPTTTPTQTQAPVSKTNAADWSAYGSSTKGFSLKYPSDWNYFEEPNEVSFGPNIAETHGALASGATGMVIHIFSPGYEMKCNNGVCKYLAETTSLSDFLTATAAPIDPKQKTVMTLPATIGGETAMAWTGYYPNIVDVKHGGNIFEIQRYYGNGADRQNLDAEFNAIVDSIVFDARRQGPSDKTYSSNQYGFKLQYPSDFAENGQAAVAEGGILHLDYSGTQFANTTFDSARLTISATSTPKQACLGVNGVTGAPTTDQKKIGDNTFYINDAGSGGTGYWRTGKDLHIYHGTYCYDVLYIEAFVKIDTGAGLNDGGQDVFGRKYSQSQIDAGNRASDYLDPIFAQIISTLKFAN